MEYTFLPFGKTYLTGDTYFNDKVEANRLALTLEEYNDKIVNSINSVVKKEDVLIIIGEVGEGLDTLKEQLLRLNSDTIIILSEKFLNRYEGQLDNFVSSKIFVSSIDGVQDIDYQNNKYNLIYCANGKNLEHYTKKHDIMRKSYIAAAASQGTKEILKNRVLNVSLSEWGYEPLEISERIPQIIDDMILFETMAAKEEIK